MASTNFWVLDLCHAVNHRGGGKCFLQKFLISVFLLSAEGRISLHHYINLIVK